jgi:hypothetical protein
MQGDQLSEQEDPNNKVKNILNEHPEEMFDSCIRLNCDESVGESQSRSAKHSSESSTQNMVFKMVSLSEGKYLSTVKNKRKNIWNQFIL